MSPEGLCPNANVEMHIKKDNNKIFIVKKVQNESDYPNSNLYHSLCFFPANLIEIACKNSSVYAMNRLSQRKSCDN